jgi:hypothetical protein
MSINLIKVWSKTSNEYKRLSDCDLNNYYKIWWEERYNIERNDDIRLNKKSV